MFNFIEYTNDEVSPFGLLSSSFSFDMAPSPFFEKDPCLKFTFNRIHLSNKPIYTYLGRRSSSDFYVVYWAATDEPGSPFYESNTSINDQDLGTYVKIQLEDTQENIDIFKKQFSKNIKALLSKSNSFFYRKWM